MSFGIEKKRSFGTLIGDENRINVIGSVSAPSSPRKKLKSPVFVREISLLTLPIEINKIIFDYLPLNDQLKPVCKIWRFIFESNLLEPKLSFIMDAEKSFSDWKLTYPSLVSKFLKIDRVRSLTLDYFYKSSQNGHPCESWYEEHFQIINNSKNRKELVIRDNCPGYYFMKIINNKSLLTLELGLSNRPIKWMNMIKSIDQYSEIKVEILSEGNPFDRTLNPTGDGLELNYIWLTSWMKKIFNEGKMLQSFIFSISFDDESDAQELKDCLELILDECFKTSSVKSFQAFINYTDLPDDEDVGLLTIERKKG